jgi:hypothetical protein
MKVREDEGLRKWIVYVYKDDHCPCEYEFKNLGLQDGVSMGKGWVRLTTEPGCPHHGTSD